MATLSGDEVSESPPPVDLEQKIEVTTVEDDESSDEEEGHLEELNKPPPVTSQQYLVRARVEIPLGSRVKYEIDKYSGDLVVDRMLFSASSYFFNYGYIVDTLGGDGDPLDAVILCEEPIHPTALINCKVVGMLKTKDEKGRDEKIVLVPDNKTDYSSVEVNDINDISKKRRLMLYDFFNQYKMREPGKESNVKKKLYDRDAAVKVVQRGQKDYVAGFVISRTISRDSAALVSE